MCCEGGHSEGLGKEAQVLRSVGDPWKGPGASSLQLRCLLPRWKLVGRERGEAGEKETGGSWRRTQPLLAPALLGVCGRETGAGPHRLPLPAPAGRRCEPRGAKREVLLTGPGAEAEQNPEAGVAPLARGSRPPWDGRGPRSEHPPPVLPRAPGGPGRCSPWDGSVEGRETPECPPQAGSAVGSKNSDGDVWGVWAGQ